MNNVNRSQYVPPQQRAGGQRENQFGSLPNLPQNNTQGTGNAQRAPNQTGQASQNRTARTIQVEDEFEPEFHSTDLPENYEG